MFCHLDWSKFVLKWLFPVEVKNSKKVKIYVDREIKKTIYYTNIERVQIWENL